MKVTLGELARGRGSRLAGWLAALLALSAWTVLPVLAADGGVRAKDSPAPIAPISLDIQEVVAPVINWGLQYDAQAGPFRKEPQVAGRAVVRGLFRFGTDATNTLAFLWDRSGAKLYLDLNRNQDLTDDPAGIYSSRAGFNDNYQSFTNLHLAFRTAAGTRQVLADLSVWNYSGRANFTLGLRSFWQGKLNFQERVWQAGLIENVANGFAATDGGFLVLRAWADREKAFSTYDGSSQAFGFAQKLFFGGHAYAVKLQPEPRGPRAGLRLEFAEEHPALGEMTIRGKYIQRLVLEGGPYLVVLDQPGATARVPVGVYGEPKVCLESGGVGAYRESRAVESNTFRIGTNGSTPLLVGGPLTNSVSVTRRGSGLYLSYQLLGLGGDTYTRKDPDRTKPPEFTAVQDGKKIGSGKFEFG
jgi:hypothetical protein